MAKCLALQSVAREGKGRSVRLASPPLVDVNSGDPLRVMLVLTVALTHGGDGHI